MKTGNSEIWTKKWSQLSESNRRPADYKSTALPTELSWPVLFGSFQYAFKT